MAHFAKIGSNNLVEEVVVVNNEVITDTDGVEQEQLGIDFLTNLTGHTNWKKTSYNTLAGAHKNGGTPFRKNYAVVGYTYDATRDAFYESQPFTSWTLNDTTCMWEAPLSLPSDASDEIIYEWNEDLYQSDNTKGWVLREFE
tara:strand:- start:28 stop:453 length:426 start_codon:yes stop_codon:yes gene_type:complete